MLIQGAVSSTQAQLQAEQQVHASVQLELTAAQHQHASLQHSLQQEKNALLEQTSKVWLFTSALFEGKQPE